MINIDKFMDIPFAAEWKEVRLIEKGWSDDKKYLVETFTGEKLLLRLSDISNYDKKKKEYEIINKYAKLGFVMSTPVGFGKCNQGQNVYIRLNGRKNMERMILML